MITGHRLPLLPWLALAALAAVGCGGPDFQAICEKAEDCVEGNEKDIEACVVGLEATADAADAIGCTEEFDAFYECFGEKFSCEGIEDDACEVESRALGRCY